MAELCLDDIPFVCFVRKISYTEALRLLSFVLPTAPFVRFFWSRTGHCSLFRLISRPTATTFFRLKKSDNLLPSSMTLRVNDTTSRHGIDTTPRVKRQISKSFHAIIRPRGSSPAQTFFPLLLSHSMTPSHAGRLSPLAPLRIRSPRHAASHRTQIQIQHSDGLLQGPHHRQ